MKKTISFYDFRNEFISLRPDNFSYEGLEALFNYFESLEEETGVEIELDVIGICCDYSEYASLEEFNRDYGEEFEEIEDIADVTELITINDERFIIRSF